MCPTEAKQYQQQNTKIEQDNCNDSSLRTWKITHIDSVSEWSASVPCVVVSHPSPALSGGTDHLILTGFYISLSDQGPITVYDCQSSKSVSFADL